MSILMHKTRRNYKPATGGSVLFRKKNEKVKNGQNVIQKGAKCMYFYVQNESRRFFIRKKSVPPVAGL